MASSLDTLAKNLITKGKDIYENFNNINQHFNSEEMELICQQGVYPYEWVDDPMKIKETTLPGINAFYSKIKLSGI